MREGTRYNYNVIARRNDVAICKRLRRKLCRLPRFARNDAFISILLLAFISLMSASCMNDDSLRDFEKLNQNNTEEGVFIVNEGNFMYSNASLSYYNPKTKVTTNDVFYKTNALPLGDVAQSITINDSIAYVVLNNSGKIYIINTKTFKYTGKITGLTSPRFIHLINENKAYVSDLYAKSISIIDLQSNTNRTYKHRKY